MEAKSHELKITQNDVHESKPGMLGRCKFS